MTDYQLAEQSRTLVLRAGITATVTADPARSTILLSIVEETKPLFTIQIPSQAASDLAVALVNAANGL